jgi:type IV pilus assembly protein PilE
MTLLELLIVLTLAGLVLFGAFGLTREQTTRIRLAEARLALIQNARFLEKWYADHGCYCQAGKQWVALPVPGTRFYTIRFGSRDERRRHHYRLWARPRTDWLGADFSWLGNTALLMDQDGLITECRDLPVGDPVCDESAAP